MSVSSQQNLSDHELCVLLREGDQTALSTLYTRHAPVLLGLLSVRTNNPKAAEEALKETFLNVWTSADCYDDRKTSPLSWMIRIARESACLDVQSTNHQPHIPPEKLPTEPVKETSQLTEIYPLLTSSEKEVLDLVYLKGFSCADAAQHLKLPVKTVTTNLRMAINHLKTTQKA